jgi:uncharacterized membrane protein YdfJ with MMPL/SSD domain
VARLKGTELDGPPVLRAQRKQLQQDVQDGGKFQDVQELVEEVEKRMQVLEADGDAITHVEQELKDQQEAMDHIMDMVDKSATVDVRSTHAWLNSQERVEPVAQLIATVTTHRIPPTCLTRPRPSCASSGKSKKGSSRT